MTDLWTRACSLDSLPVGGRRIFKRDGHQIALFRPERDAVYAVDNLCPHQGYPLYQGDLKDCVLTCVWHNYKFDLHDGRCVFGEENVRSYPTRLAGDTVEIDLAPPDLALEVPRLLRSLKSGLHQGYMGAVARDTVRLLEAGMPPAEILAFGACFDAQRSEQGVSHALPVAADMLDLLPRFPGAEAVLPVVQALEVASEESRRRRRRVASGAIEPPTTAREFSDLLFDRVENEKWTEADGLLRGALAAGWKREAIEPAFLGLCTAHFLSFGHGLIYTHKAFDLIEAAGWRHAETLLPGLLFSLSWGTREDLLPTMRALGRRLDRIRPELDALRADLVEPETVAWDRGAFVSAVLDAGAEGAVDAVERALRAGVAAEDIARALSLAAAERLLRFDERLARDTGVNEGWLDVTHLQTFATSVRHMLARIPDGSALALLFQSAAFIERAAPLDHDEGERPSIDPAEGSIEIPDLIQALEARDPDRAVSCAHTLLRDGIEASRLREALEALPLGDRLTRPIVIAHAFKNTRAAFDDHEALGDDVDAVKPVLAVVRWLATAQDERFLARLVREARDFVLAARPPHRLTG
jgi:nitrite reductase/ring-hydroxylating ferredoxin subunit